MTQTQTTAERIDALINNGVLCECEGVPPGGPMHGVWKVAATIAAEIDALTAERDEAYAVLHKRTAERDEAQRLIDIYSTSRDPVIAQLGEMNDALRAEVARLRPAADLGDAYLASIDEDADDNDIADLQDALEAAAERAREARK